MMRAGRGKDEGRRRVATCTFRMIFRLAQLCGVLYTRNSRNERAGEALRRPSARHTPPARAPRPGEVSGGRAMERVSPNPASSGEPAVDAEAALSRAPPVPWSSVEAFCFHHAHVATHRHIVTRPHAPPLVPEAAAVSAAAVSAAAAPARGGSRLAAPREGTPGAGKGARGGFETTKPDARFTLPPRGWDPPPPELAQLEGRPTPNETASPPRLPRIVGSLVDPACDHPPREFADAALFRVRAPRVRDHRLDGARVPRPRPRRGGRAALEPVRPNAPRRDSRCGRRERRARDHGRRAVRSRVGRGAGARALVLPTSARRVVSRAGEGDASEARARFDPRRRRRRGGVVMGGAGVERREVDEREGIQVECLKTTTQLCFFHLGEYDEICDRRKTWHPPRNLALLRALRHARALRHPEREIDAPL